METTSSLVWLKVTSLPHMIHYAILSANWLLNAVPETHSFTNPNLRCDILLKTGFAKVPLLDFAVIHMCAPSNLSAAVAAMGGASTKYAKDVKWRKYGAFVPAHNAFIPMVVDSLGAWNSKIFDEDGVLLAEDAEFVFRTLTKATAARLDGELSLHRTCVMSQLMTSVYRAIGHTLSKMLCSL